MVNWGQLESEAPTLAREVRRVLQAATSHVLATLRRDGSPRVSGIEVQFAGDELTIGSMAQSMKALDLRRDPRFALHSSPAEGGDAKLAGRVVEAAGPPDQDSHTFQLDLSMAAYTSIGTGSDHLLIQIWHPGQPVQSSGATGHYGGARVR